MERFSKDIIFPYDTKGRRAIELIQNIAYRISGQVYLEKNGREINLSSLLGLLSLDLHKGDNVTIKAYIEKNLEILEEILTKEEL